MSSPVCELKELLCLFVSQSSASDFAPLAHRLKTSEPLIQLDPHLVMGKNQSHHEKEEEEKDGDSHTSLGSSSNPGISSKSLKSLLAADHIDHVDDDDDDDDDDEKKKKDEEKPLPKWKRFLHWVSCGHFFKQQSADDEPASTDHNSSKNQVTINIKVDPETSGHAAAGAGGRHHVTPGHGHAGRGRRVSRRRGRRSPAHGRRRGHK